MKKGKLHLIPNILAENAIQTLPFYLIEIVTSIKFFYVEEIKSARRLLKKLNKEINIDDLTFYILNEHENESLIFAKKIWNDGNDIGFISEAGCPSVADPGQEMVKIAHQQHVTVIPHVGPNSILLALMASGFNGQQFNFLGYLPNKQPMLSLKIKEIEKESQLKNCTQIFIETPYRNDQLILEIVKNCQQNTKLCIACNLTSQDETIFTKTIGEWKSNIISFHKKPAVFLLFAND